MRRSPIGGSEAGAVSEPVCSQAAVTRPMLSPVQGGPAGAPSASDITRAHQSAVSTEPISVGAGAAEGIAARAAASCR
ncbi:hypothetical protein [Paractinoplanes maris]|uniref:hypothetical protein n=1 Tax=Paractinoplanes maris TaxID=1734446 RepID=UPI00201FC4C7|nr:hypothetical protein [Actinoplanes maris]